MGHNGSVGASVVYSWTEAGSYTLTLTATHAYPSMDVQQLAVMVGQKYDVFLPLITRDF